MYINKSGTFFEYLVLQKITGTYIMWR